jgi:predicted PurR-regulated permease PerM
MNGQRTLVMLGSLTLVVAAFYLAQKILIPLALATLIAFILTPGVLWLQRHRLPRIVAVLLMVALSLGLVVGVFWMVSAQVAQLANELPGHTETIKAKIADLQSNSQGVISRFADMLHEITKEIQDKEVQRKEQQQGAGAAAREEAEKPVPVVVLNQNPLTYSMFAFLAVPTVEVLLDTLFVTMLVIFMLMRREDLRDRIIQLVGHGSLTVTTRALDEAADGISSFLLMQLAINAVFGICLGLGLHFLGVKFAFLWGILGGVLRFVPYIGVWVALLFPLTLSVALFDGWAQPMKVLGLFVALELLAANVGEPLLFSHSTGASPVALLVAAAFWAWLWGPIGLVLSTPLMVCLIVLSRYVPGLGFFGVLLGSEPVLGAPVRYYQRLLAEDQDEAIELVEDYLQTHPVEGIYDQLLLPALVMAQRDRQRGELSKDAEAFIYQATRAVLEDIVSPQQAAGSASTPAAEREKVCVLGCPARSEADELALQMFHQLMEPAGWNVEVVSGEKLCAEVVSQVEEEQPSMVVIASVPPGGLAQTRYLCKRLRLQDPDLKIAVGRWGQGEVNEKIQERLLSAGADYVAITLLETRAQVVPLIQVAAAVPATA